MHQRNFRPPRRVPALGIAVLLAALQGCALLPPAPGPSAADGRAATAAALPAAYPGGPDADDSAREPWREFFHDPGLLALIDTALAHNQELNVLLQEIEVARNEARARSGEYLPFVHLRAGAGVDKVGEYTREGAVEENLEVKRGKAFPEPLPDFVVGADISWEVDVWKKLRNATRAAVLRYLATREGRVFMETHLVAEIADAWYELMALDSRLAILDRMIALQESALAMVKVQKEAARATELAVLKFEAEVLKNQSRRFELRQQMTQVENRLNTLAGRYPEPVSRPSDGFAERRFDGLHAGNPADLLAARPDVRQAELELQAAELDVTVARARFYPSLDLSAAIGLEAFETGALVTTPESMLYRVAADLMVPLFNRRAIEAAYASATAQQLQALYRYQQTVLRAYVEVVNQVARMDNLSRSFALKHDQVSVLTASVSMADSLFKSARADYMEVLLTQRDALEARMELVELKQAQANAWVLTYQALGGGSSLTDG